MAQQGTVPVPLSRSGRPGETVQGGWVSAPAYPTTTTKLIQFMAAVDPTPAVSPTPPAVKAPRWLVAGFSSPVRPLGYPI